MSESLESRVRIRDGETKDCAEILRLITELAVYEKMADQVKMTKEVLEEDGFGKEKIFNLIVAEDKENIGTLVGYALYFYVYSTFEGRCLFLEDIYISPDYRKSGLGTRLFKKAAQIAIDRKCQRLSWNVLDWNSSAIKFYKGFGAINMTEREGWNSYRLERNSIEKLAAS